MHGLSIDIEDWFQVFYGEKQVGYFNWDKKDTTLPYMIDEILNLLSHHDLKATFFLVGWIAYKYPNLVRKISDSGHEIGSHSFYHKEIYTQTRDEFKKDLIISKNTIEDVIGKPIQGYRAPGFSIRSNMIWAVEDIKEAGYVYDSSLLYSKKRISRLSNGLIEIAPNAVNFMNNYFPTNGGFFFRLIPIDLFFLYLRFLEFRKDKLIFYTHSWEVYIKNETIKMPPLKRFIQYYNLKTVLPKLSKLFSKYDFCPLSELIQDIND